MSFQFDTTVSIRGTLPRVSFEKIARAILGNNYSLSLVVCGDALSRVINKKYRPGRSGKKDYSPNVLSFPISRSEGEIFLNMRKAEREARALRVSIARHTAFLFVHGCLHLKGLKHGKKMDDLEQRYVKKAGF
ncbi:MAG: Endoribonuclease YbeY [Parcubacteria group bacterium Gr01-1014_8]|nr:MAG: Endoribonuclease YbeY [Parcubacteria group bacterium Gr01-1014_8]